MKGFCLILFATVVFLACSKAENKANHAYTKVYDLKQVSSEAINALPVANFVSFKDQDGTEIEINKHYDVMPGKATWENGGSAGIYIGLRNSKMSKNRFRMSMPNHMKMVRDKFKPFGLLGYVVFISNDYEFAFMLWKSREHNEIVFDPKRQTSEMRLAVAEIRADGKKLFEKKKSLWTQIHDKNVLKTLSKKDLK